MVGGWREDGGRMVGVWCKRGVRLVGGWWECAKVVGGWWEWLRGIRHQFLQIVNGRGPASHHSGASLGPTKWPINHYLSYHLDSLPKINFPRPQDLRDKRAHIYSRSILR